MHARDIHAPTFSTIAFFPDKTKNWGLGCSSIMEKVPPKRQSSSNTSFLKVRHIGNRASFSCMWHQLNPSDSNIGYFSKLTYFSEGCLPCFLCHCVCKISVGVNGWFHWKALMVDSENVSTCLTLMIYTVGQSRTFRRRSVREEVSKCIDMRQEECISGRYRGTIEEYCPARIHLELPFRYL